MPSTCSSAPKDKYASSTRLIAACATSSPISSGRSPPTSCESDSFPSENAPAPEKPVVMRHGSQPTQCPTFALGQLRRSMGRPFSTSAMVVEGASFRSANAVKIPAGPAPTITTSTVIFELQELPKTETPLASPGVGNATHFIVAHEFRRPAKAFGPCERRTRVNHASDSRFLSYQCIMQKDGSSFEAQYENHFVKSQAATYSLSLFYAV